MIFSSVFETSDLFYLNFTQSVLQRNYVLLCTVTIYVGFLASRRVGAYHERLDYQLGSKAWTPECQRYDFDSHATSNLLPLYNLAIFLYPGECIGPMSKGRVINHRGGRKHLHVKKPPNLGNLSKISSTIWCSMKWHLPRKQKTAVYSHTEQIKLKVLPVAVFRTHPVKIGLIYKNNSINTRIYCNKRCYIHKYIDIL